MRPQRLAAPQSAVSLADIKAHLRLGHAEEDARVTAALQAAQAALDGPSGALDGFCIRRQTWRSFHDGFPASGAPLELPLRPVASVTSVTYLDAAGAAQTLPLAGSLAFADARGSFLLLADGQDWPDTMAGRPDAVRVEAVYGHEDQDVPADILQAVRLLAAHWYENGAAAAFGGGFGQLPMGVEMITANHRRLADIA